jgi:acetylornithine deacetylase
VSIIGLLADVATGSVGVNFNLTGVAAHSAYEELGVSAVDYLSEAIVALNTLEPYLPKGELLGDSTLNTGRIVGGLAGNIVAAFANATTSVRVAGGELDTFEELITIALQPIKERMDAAGGLFNYTITKNYGAIILDTDFDFLPQKAMKYGTDIPSLPQVEKRYLFGPGSITVAHTPGEFLSVPELLASVEAYGQMIEQLAGGSS